MSTTQSAGSPLAILLLAAAIYLVGTSPKKLQTLTRMVIAFVVTALLFLVPGVILSVHPVGEPSFQQCFSPYGLANCRMAAGAWGELGGVVSMLIAVIVGRWHVRSVKRACTGVSGEPPPKP